MTDKFSHILFGLQNTTAWVLCVLVVTCLLAGVYEMVRYALDCLAARLYLAPPRASGPSTVRKPVQSNLVHFRSNRVH